MSYGVTPKGWVSKPLSKIMESLSKRAKNEFGDNFPTTPESVFGQLANIFAASSKDNWDMAEGVASMQNRETAEGVYLDFLARLIGLTRQKARGSSGQLLFTGRENTFIPAFTISKDSASRKVITKQSLTLNRASCYQTTFEIKRLENNTKYTIVVESTETSYTTGSSATFDDIITGLMTAINANTRVTAVKGEIANTLVLTYPSYNNNLTTTNTDNINLYSIGSLVDSESALTGKDINFAKNSVNALVTSILTIDSVNNLVAFQNGRDRETDEELRLRMSQREESAGTATKPSIETAVSEVTGVQYALVEVNDTLNDNPSTGIPAKSFETFVTGGDEQKIAEVIWKTKSLFGQTHGDISKEIKDENGNTQSVKFSRPSNNYAWVKVKYSINPEESFPADGQDAMTAAVVNYGKAMAKGEDLAPTKFYGALYTVQGVYIEEITVAVTTSESEVPVYGSQRIPISAIQNLLFDTSRVVIST